MRHADSEKLLGYEIRRNGKAIGFTISDTYTDDLGAANNLTYRYSVVPVDKLGNLGVEASSNEVRVSYDKTISADLYDQKWEDGTITITMKRGASVPVIIIKVTGAELTGSYTLSVKADAGAAEWSAAKTGELSGDSVVAYFTKPGAEPFFVDVVSGAWYECAVRYAAEAGLMAGTGDGRFSPEVTTTRGMIVTILHRMETGVSD